MLPAAREATAAVTAPFDVTDFSKQTDGPREGRVEASEATAKRTDDALLAVVEALRSGTTTESTTGARAERGGTRALRSLHAGERVRGRANEMRERDQDSANGTILEISWLFYS